ncbi:amidohydrolase family protein [Streptomyces sp. NPDC057456]|uniref:amidohydrolase family protein n=1 Tax=Streptomyces sp. NPDC057456 TaxID=3346139 RepID=UPI00369BB94A
MLALLSAVGYSAVTLWARKAGTTSADAITWGAGALCLQPFALTQGVWPRSGHTTSETGRPIPYIDQVALDFPELTVVCGHIGYPWTTEMISVADKHENVYIDTSAYTARRYPAELVQYLRGRGRRKVLFGTNYPMITPAQALEHLDQLELDEEARELFLSGNARRVFAL